MTWLPLLSFSLALALALLAGPLMVPQLRRWKWGQSIRGEGPRSHLAKSGTPTMGGLIFLPATLLAAWWTAGHNAFLGIALVLFLGFGLVGFLDDYVKVVTRRPLGLKARYKLLGQVVLALYLGWEVASGLGTRLTVPITGWQLDPGPLYVPFALFVVLGAANAANLTDGLDGLLAGATVVIGLAYTLISLWAGRPELASFAAALAGGCLGFLRYNLHPARVFMGDTGSLAIGGALAALAMMTKTELWLVLVGGLLVVETLSVILQVASFRLLGRRIFRMSPLHHHFELTGWSETQVVHRFWLFAAISAIIGLWDLGRSLGG